MNGTIKQRFEIISNYVLSIDVTTLISPEHQDLCSRITSASLPFLALHQPLRYPLGLTKGTLIIWKQGKTLLGEAQPNDSQLAQALQLCVSITILTAAIFAHPSAGILKTTQELIIGSYTLYSNVHTDPWLDLPNTTLKLCTGAIFLILLSLEWPELAVLSLLLQTVSLILTSIKEFRADCWIEATSAALMSAVRATHARSQYNEITRA